MSEGPLTELVAIGAQNVDLITDEPAYSIFQDPIKKITNFSKASFNMHHKGNANWGSTMIFNIERKGDLLSTSYLVIELPTISVEDIETYEQPLKDFKQTDLRVVWSNVLGYAVIEKAIIRIGGQVIDEMSGEFMQLITDMHHDWNRFYMLGHDGTINRPSTKIEGQTIYIPLKFWFAQNINKALPLVALQYHNVEIEIKLRDFSKLTNVLRVVQDEMGSTMLIHTNFKLKKKNIINSYLDCTYIYLSPEERKHIAEKEHKILITQCQERKLNTNNNTIDLDFNHVVKEIFFFVQPQQNLDEGEVFNFSGKLNYPPAKFNENKYDIPNGAIKKIKLAKDLWDELPKSHHIKRARILLNGHERVQWKDYKYYYYVQPYENFKNPNDHHYYTYSFSANSRALGNYGGCNYSRIDNSQLQLEYSKPLVKAVSRTSDSDVTLNNIKDGIISVYAHNFNYLKIKGGMAGVEFNN